MKRLEHVRPALDGAMYAAGIYAAVFGLPILYAWASDPGSAPRRVMAGALERVRDARRFEESVRADLDQLETVPETEGGPS